MKTYQKKIFNNNEHSKQAMINLKHRSLPINWENRLKIYDVNFEDERYTEPYYTNKMYHFCPICYSEQGKKVKTVPIKKFINRCHNCNAYISTMYTSSFQKFLHQHRTKFIASLTGTGTGKTTENLFYYSYLMINFGSLRFLGLSSNSIHANMMYNEIIEMFPEEYIKKRSQGKQITLKNNSEILFKIVEKGKNIEEFRGLNLSGVLIMEASEPIFWQNDVINGSNGRNLIDILWDRVRHYDSIQLPQITTEGTNRGILQLKTATDKPYNYNDFPVGQIILETNVGTREFGQYLMKNTGTIYISNKIPKAITNNNIEIISSFWKQTQDKDKQKGVLIMGTSLDNPKYNYFDSEYSRNIGQESLFADVSTWEKSIFYDIDKHKRNIYKCLQDYPINEAHLHIGVDPGISDPVGWNIRLYWPKYDIGFIYSSEQSDKEDYQSDEYYQRKINDTIKYFISKYHWVKKKNNIVITFDTQFFNRNQSSNRRKKTFSRAESLEKLLKIELQQSWKANGSIDTGFDDFRKRLDEGKEFLNEFNNDLLFLSLKELFLKDGIKTKKGESSFRYQAPNSKNDHIRDALRYNITNKKTQEIKQKGLKTIQKNEEKEFNSQNLGYNNSFINNKNKQITNYGKYNHKKLRF